METPQDLMRTHYPEFLAELNKFKEVFGNIKREYIKCSVGEWGAELKGVAINPIISDKIIRKENDRNSK